MNKENNSIRISLWSGIVFLLLIVLIEFLAIMNLNHGLLVYTLDDPYIHLALARHIIQGHYGINSIEFSAPSSTIIWPFLLAPFSSYAYFPFLLNIIVSIATVFVYTKILTVSFQTKENKNRLLITSFLFLLILATNLVGLIFTGMEHSLQVLITAVIAYGLIIEIKNNRITRWLLIAIIAAPLVRYENLGISIAALCYLIFNRYTIKAAYTTAILVVLVGGFSLFLIQLGLDPLPTSIIVKSSVVGSGGTLYSILENIWHALNDGQGIILSLGIATLLIFMFIDGDIKRKKLAFAAVVALLIHLFVGKYNYFNRYEIYVWTFFLLIVLFLAAPVINKILERGNKRSGLIWVIIISICMIFILSTRYIGGLFDIPIASNNIYEQQYQMHRFAVDYYNKPVAVNDLGYVSYKNDNYVLDLYGLASFESLEDRKSEKNTKWMQNLTDEKQTGLAMIYEEWFHSIPKKWIKIGDLYLGKRQITPAYFRVAFYATNPEVYPEIVTKLKSFIKTLPEDVKFIFEKNPSVSNH